MTLGTLLTFGYQGLENADALRDLLKGVTVDRIIDVRLSPWSGNRAFSLKTRATVEAAGLEYLHLRDLGNLLYKSEGIQIKDIEAIEVVLDLLRAGESVAIMCVCPDWVTCHRAELAAEAVRREPALNVRHLALFKRPAPMLSLDLRPAA